eukprot:5786894-Pleurochrysis_carterae.AAC.1
MATYISLCYALRCLITRHTHAYFTLQTHIYLPKPGVPRFAPYPLRTLLHTSRTADTDYMDR